MDVVAEGSIKFNKWPRKEDRLLYIVLAVVAELAKASALIQVEQYKRSQVPIPLGTPVEMLNILRIIKD